MKKTFEDYLMDIHFASNPILLGDNLIDDFDAWIALLTSDELIDYADEWGKQIIK